MNKLRKITALGLLAVLMCVLVSCSSKQADITFLGMNDSKTLTIQYTPNMDVELGKSRFKLIVSGKGTDTTAYNYSDIQSALNSGQGYISLYDMFNIREWMLDGSLEVNGETFTESVEVEDIMSYFDIAVLTVELYIDDVLVDSKKL